MKRRLATLLLLLAALPAAAGEPPPGPAAPPAQEAAATSTSPDDRPVTQAELKALAEEVRRLKLEQASAPEFHLGSYSGMGVGASQVHLIPKGLSVGGYGEMVYSNYSDDRVDWAEVLRLVLYVGYRFDERIVFNSEIEFEHGAKEISIELAYVDFTLAEPITLRVGNVLVPVGFLNENHEPIFFHGVYRPRVDQVIIPTTWNQNGVGFYGSVGVLRYKAYLLTGLDAFGPQPLEAPTWIRNGRTGAFGPARTWAGVANLNVDVGPATFGGSFYGGSAGQGNTDAAGAPISPVVLLGEVHALLAWKGITARTILALGSLSQAGALSAARGLAPEKYVGSRAWGTYVELGYDVLTLVGSSMSLVPFVRFEALNPQAAVEGAGVLDPVLDQRVLVAGVDFRPIPQVVVKADWQQTWTGTPGTLNQWDLGVGFVY